ncbi:hypothetical protein FIE12Z_5539 [Fusarium flagelliforme]|uniref:Uncharacterized protein n=1 Tax=Fusarium flagelliforme TaxID=2675880 RepID=A0A395MRN5_9HYPO|nr:hypothetical protein FIE12Z_5539 [Fusarium flagelliforme]
MGPYEQRYAAAIEREQFANPEMSVLNRCADLSGKGLDVRFNDGSYDTLIIHTRPWRCYYLGGFGSLYDFEALLDTEVSALCDVKTPQNYSTTGLDVIDAVED